MRIGLAASRRHRGAEGALARWLAECGRALADELGAELLIVGQTYDDLVNMSLVPAGLAARRLPTRRQGGLIRLVAGVVDEKGPDALDAVVYLLDPDDPTSLFPEGLALKRECVIHCKPFISTLTHARLWVEEERLLRGAPADPRRAAQFCNAGKTIALVAHDACKPAMIAFAHQHFSLLDQFERRIATGTTGALLNTMAEGLRGGSIPWVQRFQSGPEGGDAQIARELLAGRCERVIFFEDPRVAREHEADIQLLERSARMVGDGVPCLADPRSAERWAKANSGSSSAPH